MIQVSNQLSQTGATEILFCVVGSEPNSYGPVCPYSHLLACMHVCSSILLTVMGQYALTLIYWLVCTSAHLFYSQLWAGMPLLSYMGRYTIAVLLYSYISLILISTDSNKFYKVILFLYLSSNGLLCWVCLWHFLWVWLVSLCILLP